MARLEESGFVGYVAAVPEIPHEPLSGILDLLPEPTRITIRVLSAYKAMFGGAVESLSNALGTEGRATPSTVNFDLEGGTKADILKFLAGSESSGAPRNEDKASTGIRGQFKEAVWILGSGLRIELTSYAINVRFIGEEPELVAKIKSAASGQLEFDTQITIAPSGRTHQFNPHYDEGMRKFL